MILSTCISSAQAFKTTSTTFYGIKVGVDVKWTTLAPNEDTECLPDAVALACSIQSDRPVAELEALINQFPIQFTNLVGPNKIFK